MSLTIGQHSNALTVGTGYGAQSALMIPRWQAQGHKVIHSGFYGIQGAPLQLDDLLILPTSKDAYGNDILIDDFQHWKFDITVTLIDAWIFSPQIVSQIRWVPYFPVDTDPIAPPVANVLRAAYRPVAYAKFGVEKAKEAGINVTYIPHMVDTRFYAPMDRAESRKSLGAPDDKADWFMVAIVAANKGNPSRKAFDQQIRAFAEFHRRYPKSVLALHTDVWGGHDGENISRICQLAGLEPEAVAFPPKYEFLRGMISNNYLRRLYSACDVLLNATRAEGFGVPIIEAMSCERPAIVTDFSAMPELVDAGAGWKVPVADKFFYQDSYQSIPSVAGIVEALEKAYEAKQNGTLAEMGKKARAGMIATYDADMVAERYWKPFFAEIEADLKAQEERKNGRAARRAALRANGGPIKAGMLTMIGNGSPELFVPNAGDGSTMLVPVVPDKPVDGGTAVVTTHDAPLTDGQVEQVLLKVAEALNLSA